MTRKNDLIDELLKDCEIPEDILGKDGWQTTIYTVEWTPPWMD